MHFGLVISVLLHAAILGWTILSFQSQRELRVPETEPIAVGMVTPAELTKVRPGARTAKLLEAQPKETPKEADPAKKEAAKARRAATAPPPPASEPPAPKAAKKTDPIARKLAEASPPPPVPAAGEQKALDAAKAKAKREADEKRRADEQRQAEEKRRAEEQRRAAEKKRAEEKHRAEGRRKAEERRQEAQRRQAELKRKAEARKRAEAQRRQQAEAAKRKRFDADRIAALLNKVPDKSAPPPSAPPTEPTKDKGPVVGAREGRDKQISASERAMLNGIIESRLRICWRVPSAGGGSDTPAVTLRWHLRPDGSLDGDPEVVESTRNDALFRLAAEAAIRAVRECAPFPLPPDKYSVWKTIIRDFDPKHML